ncbi:hypothetical protein SK128_021640 [Halocaridina rubra]|uniref:Secreted protein n=1 Tax=Halocaridina rubra TaxID=373956 RepID=A0AAN8WMK0_HALRR
MAGVLILLIIILILWKGNMDEVFLTPFRENCSIVEEFFSCAVGFFFFDQVAICNEQQLLVQIKVKAFDRPTVKSSLLFVFCSDYILVKSTSLLGPLDPFFYFQVAQRYLRHFFNKTFYISARFKCFVSAIYFASMSLPLHTTLPVVKKTLFMTDFCSVLVSRLKDMLSGCYDM